MKSVFGVVSLVVVLAIVGLVMARQMKASHLVSGGAVPAASGTPRQQSEQIQKQVADDVDKALLEGAARRASAAE